MSYGIKISVYDGVARIVNHASMELDIPFDDAKALFNELKYVAIDVVKSIYNDGWVQCMHEYAVRTCPNDCYVSTRVYTLNGDRVF